MLEIAGSAASGDVFSVDSSSLKSNGSPMSQFLDDVLEALDWDGVDGVACNGGPMSHSTVTVLEAGAGELPNGSPMSQSLGNELDGGKADSGAPRASFEFHEDAEAIVTCTGSSIMVSGSMLVDGLEPVIADSGAARASFVSKVNRE